MTDETSRARRGMNDETPPDGDPYTAYDEFDLPAYVGLPSFQKLPWMTDAAAQAAAKPDVAIVGAPFDDAVSHRPGARFGPRAIRQASYHTGSINSLGPWTSPGWKRDAGSGTNVSPLMRYR